MNWLWLHLYRCLIQHFLCFDRVNWDLRKCREKIFKDRFILHRQFLYFKARFSRVVFVEASFLLQLFRILFILLRIVNHVIEKFYFHLIIVNKNDRHVGKVKNGNFRLLNNFSIFCGNFDQRQLFWGRTLNENFDELDALVNLKDFSILAQSIPNTVTTRLIAKKCIVTFIGKPVNRSKVDRIKPNLPKKHTIAIGSKSRKMKSRSSWFWSFNVLKDLLVLMQWALQIFQCQRLWVWGFLFYLKSEWLSNCEISSIDVKVSLNNRLCLHAFESSLRFK